MDSSATIPYQSKPSCGDSVLLGRFVHGHDQAAFGQLVERYEPVVLGAALRRTGNLEMARDVTQQVFVTLARKATGLLQHPRLGGWLYRTASYQASRLNRSERRRRRRESKFAAEPAEAASSSEVWEPLEDALAELSAENRELIVMRYFQDRGYTEMAADLELSEGATRKRVSRALADLGERLRRAGCTSTHTTLLAGAAAAQAILSPSPALAANALAGAGAAPSSITSILATMTTAKTTTATITLGLLVVLQLGLAVSQIPKGPAATTTRAPDESDPAQALQRASEDSVPASRQMRMSLPGPRGSRVPRSIAMRTAKTTHALFDGRDVSDDLIGTLKLTTGEIAEINASLATAFGHYEEIESNTVEIGEDKDGLKTWTVPPYPEESQSIMGLFDARLVEILGEDRGAFAQMSFGHSFYFANRGKKGIRLRLRAGSNPTMQVFTGVRGGVAILDRFDKDPPIGSITGAVLEREFGHLLGDIEDIRSILESIKTSP